jgi:hypothetical protein
MNLIFHLTVKTTLGRVEMGDGRQFQNPFPPYRNEILTDSNGRVVKKLPFCL